MSNATDILIAAPALDRRDDGQYRVRCSVDGQDLYFASPSTLDANIDAFACAFLLPALAAKRPLRFADALDSELAKNLEAATAIANDFWDYGGSPPIAETRVREPAGGRGLFFTGGVDSFYTLFSQVDQVEALINVHGFDIELRDRSRSDKSRSGLQAVAEALEKELIRVETDVRSHPLFKSISWEITHAAALSAVGHVLCPVLRSISLASSDVPPPWGSHPDLDRLWSSNALTIVNDERDLRRLDKVKAIADWDLVHQQLKVCWENRSSALNCGECEKCVRTQAQFEVTGTLDKLETFGNEALENRINALPRVARELFGQWRDVRDEIAGPALREAIDRLLVRSAAPPPREAWKRFKRKARKRIRRLAKRALQVARPSSQG